MANTLTLRIVGDYDEGILDTFEFYPGEVRVLRLQLYNEDSGSAVCIPGTATKTLVLSGTPDNIQINDIDITVNADDASIFETQLTADITEKLISGMIQFQYVVVGGQTRFAKTEFGLKRLRLITE